MTDIRWGILATGGIAHAFTADLRTAGLDVAAVGSRRSEAARAFAEQYDIPHAHGSYDELVADPDVDIVYVASPHRHHLEHATLALEAGKHVLIEKAVTLDADEARALMLERMKHLEEEELSDIVIVRDLTDTEKHDMPPFMRRYLAHIFEADRS